MKVPGYSENLITSVNAQVGITGYFSGWYCPAEKINQKGNSPLKIFPGEINMCGITDFTVTILVLLSIEVERIHLF